MVDMRSRMAALRARRAARMADAAKAAQPKNVDPELWAAAQAVGAPRATWDKDYRERLAGTIESSDEEDEGIVVLPPPAIKLDPIASRVAWRKKQREIAREQAAGLMRERYPAPAPLTQPKIEESGPKEDVDDEEQLLIEEGVESDEEEVDGEEENDVEGDGEEVEDQESGSVVEEPDSCDAETQPPETVEVDGSSGQTDDPLRKSLSTNLYVSTLVDEIFDKVFVSKPFPTDAENQMTPSKLVTKSTNRASTTRTEDSQRTAESSRATFKLAAESSSTVKSNAGQDMESRRIAHVTATSASSEDCTTKKSASTAVSDRKAVTVTSGPVFGPFSRLGKNSSIVSKNASAFIDNEAEDEMNVDVDIPLAPNSDREEEDATPDDDCIEPDTTQTEGDAQRLAEFHREWQKESDIDAVRDAAKALGCERDVDNEMDLNELMQRKKEREAAEADGAGSEDDDAASFCMGGHPSEREEEAVDRYVDNMFLDKHVENEYHEDLELATPEDRKREARALWKARQRHREGRLGGDPHSISLLTLSEEDDEEDGEVKFARLKSKFVGSSEARKEHSKKRKTKASVGIGEWQLRRQAAAAIEKRRRTGVSLQDFMFKAASAETESAGLPTTKRAPRMKECSAPPVGSEVCRPTATGVPVPARRRKRVQADENKFERKKPRNSLFLSLGELPKSNV